jgi:hypothetical protein
MPRYRVKLDRVQSRIVKSLAKTLGLSETKIFATIVAIHLSQILEDSAILRDYPDARRIEQAMREAVRKGFSDSHL